MLFLAGNYSVVSGPTLLSTPRDLTLNSAFNGSSNTQLISSGGLSIGELEQIRIDDDVRGDHRNGPAGDRPEQQGLDQ